MLTHSPKGRSPLENSLLLLWVDEIERNATCRQFLSDIKIEKILQLSLDDQERISEILRESEEIKIISDEVRSIIDSLANIDYKVLEKYLLSLKKLKLERKVPFLDTFIAKMLRRVFLSENGLSQDFCKLVESLDSDDIDHSLHCEFFNSRGVLTQDVFAGRKDNGDLINHYYSLAREYALHSPRLSKIFRTLSDDYKNIVDYNDRQTMLTRYR